LTAAFVHCSALLAVGVDAALGKVVGATTCENQDAPAVGYGCFLGNGLVGYV
jgi:hypothetical protein